MDELSRLLSGAMAGSGPTSGTPAAAPAQGIGGLLGGLLGGTSTSSAATAAAGSGNLLGALAVLPALLPALLALLGNQAANGTTGLHQLVSQLESQGAGQATQSWIGNGPNLAVTAQAIEQALGPAKVSQLVTQTGLPASQVTQGVAAVLPSIVHGLTPNGQLPAPAEVQQALGGILGR